MHLGRFEGCTHGVSSHCLQSAELSYEVGRSDAVDLDVRKLVEFIGDVDLTISMFWIAPDDCIDEKLVEVQVQHNCIVSFSNLYLLCPALEDLYLIPPAQRRAAEAEIEEHLRQVASQVFSSTLG